MTYATEFPDYPSASLPAIPNDWSDASYHNDACPSWQTGSLHIWVDYPDPEQREHPAARRFTVAKLDADGCITADPPTLETDDWQQVLNLTAA